MFVISSYRSAAGQLHDIFCEYNNVHTVVQPAESVSSSLQSNSDLGLH